MSLGIKSSTFLRVFTMGSWVHDKVHVKSLDFFEPCAKAAKLSGYLVGTSTGGTWAELARKKDLVRCWPTLSKHRGFPMVYHRRLLGAWAVALRSFQCWEVEVEGET